MKEFEVVKTSASEVCCSGNEGYSSHPKIYLTIDEHTSEIVCPYCSKKFIKNNYFIVRYKL
ncbi:MAG TPA: zinc-finger domain-containing protein [Candidatus Megaira endosymbiont of Nemacystus decipiens]|nr:zinc-finger domain-containing protein [Candidatus Megaera endosymbiont of Nemacystus decipiens]